MRDSQTGDSELRSGNCGSNRAYLATMSEVAGGMIQDWIGTMFIPAATLDRTQAVLRNDPNYQIFYAPQIIDSKQLAHHADEYAVSLRLLEQHLVTVMLNTTYQFAPACRTRSIGW